MDFLNEIVDSFSLFVKSVHKADTETDFDLWKVLKVFPEQLVASNEVLLSLEKLISQLQELRDDHAKTFFKEARTEQNKELKVNDSVEATDSSNIQPAIVDVSESSGSSNNSSSLSDDTATVKPAVEVTDINPNIVQIKASKDEIERRITAFIEKKQREVNQLNNREFCSVLTPETDAEFSCARTDAVFVPRAGCKSHIKISRVVNSYGPQTNPIHEGQNSRLNEKNQSECSGLEERIKNLESHLQIKFPGVSKSDLYNRLKTLEDRILFLEGLSPEYFQKVPPPKRQKKVEGTDIQKDQEQDMSLQEIDDRIQSLQASLRRKHYISSWDD